MKKHIESFLFGLFAGMGFLVSYAVLKLIGYLISGSGPAF